MELTKKQVKAIIDIAKQNERFNKLFIEDNKMYVTNSYAAVEIELGVEIESGVYDIQEMIVWYKLASAKCIYTIENLTQRVEDSTMNFGRLFSNNIEATERISFDYKLFNAVAKVFQNKIVTIEFAGETAAATMTQKDEEDIKAIILPCRVNY